MEWMEKERGRKREGGREREGKEKKGERNGRGKGREGGNFCCVVVPLTEGE